MSSSSIIENIHASVNLIEHFYKNYHHGMACQIPKMINVINANLKSIKVSLEAMISVADKKHLAAAAGKMERYKLIINQLDASISGTSLEARPLVEWRDLVTAFKSRVSTGIIINSGHKTLGTFFSDSSKVFSNKIRHIFNKYNQPLKVNCEFCAEFVKSSSNSDNLDLDAREFSFNTRNFLILNCNLEEEDLKKLFNSNVVDYLMNRLLDFEEQQSGWALSRIISLTVNANSTTLVKASSYIDLPNEVKVKHAVINVKNNDEACFGWALSSALFPVSQHSDRVSSYPYYAEILNFQDINFPMTLSQLPKFEKQNAHLSLNVYGLIRKSVSNYITVPFYLSSNKKEQHVNLLMIQDDYEIEDNNNNNNNNNDNVDDHRDKAAKFHFCWIKNLSKLVHSQLTRNNRKLYICDRCLHYFNSQTKLSRHESDCKQMNKCRLEMPKPGTTVHFKDYQFKQTAPFIMYCDLECLVQDFHGDETRNTLKYKEHIVCSIAYYLHCTFDNSLSKLEMKRGEDCINWFTEQLVKIGGILQQYFDNPVPMKPLSDMEKLAFNAATHCHICEAPILEEQVKVKDHCHFSGQWRGASHQQCNLNYKTPHIIPLFFHNFSGYDSHFIIKNLAQAIPGKIKLLPKNKERYISFTKCMIDTDVQFRFVDSFRFMNESLEKLSSYLKFDDFKILRGTLSHLSDEQLKLLTRKGVYPYEYINDWTKFQESSLPDKNQFYSKLTESHISEAEYMHARNVWRKFNIQNLGQYSDLYLMTDVLLLSDVFTNFREKCIITHKLEPAFFFTAPGYTWQCMLNYTKVKLDLLSDIDMVLFIEKGIRGGITQCCTKYSKANNKYIENYDVNKPSSHILYMDMVNLYGWAQSQCLPQNNFKWLSEAKLKSLTPEAVMNLSDNANEGLILEVDIAYPRQLHNNHKYIPSGKDKKVSQSSIISKNHRVFSVAQSKVALRNIDDKRFTLPNGIDTLPWGHYDVPNKMDLE
ncbi:hypothetical protein PPYR_06150 [Photinus pyralis]|uniref:MYST zinc finger domain-containing protein n=1 Tax=Photinus pyralis TaxID=7054 RepID=A0A5N4AT59_PHOPY|nr:hypothetical protein PPYR_06150 [Photinus pyralis]